MWFWTVVIGAGWLLAGCFVARLLGAAIGLGEPDDEKGR
jgi:hypothetical protein